jgi:hypothetical protein
MMTHEYFLICRALSRLSICDPSIDLVYALIRLSIRTTICDPSIDLVDALRRLLV